MSTPYIIPFNHQPVNTGAGSSSYTVPLKKYARLVYTCNAQAWTMVTGGTSGNTSGTSSSANDTCNGEIWLKEGDIITVSLSNPSGSVGPATSGTITATATASILLNSSVFARASCTSAMSWIGLSASTSMSKDGTTSVYFSYEEYNVIE